MEAEESVKRKYLIRSKEAGIYEVLEPTEEAGVNGLVKGGKPIAIFQVDFDGNKGVYRLKDVKFDEALSRRERDLILAQILEFISSLNQ